MTMIQKAIEQAKLASVTAYAPYSNFKVGAAVVAKSGEVYTGCNVENSSYSLTCCAERVAIFNAISNGENGFHCIVIFANIEQPISPCGACRQVMSEFFDEKTVIYLMNRSSDIIETTINELLPYSFHLNHEQSKS